MADLKTELTTDPLGRGYAGMTDQEAADDLNTTYRTRDRTSMTGREVGAAVVKAEYAALADAQKDRVLFLFGRDDLDPFKFEADVMTDIFGGGSDTIAALAAARVEAISRALELGLRTPVRRSYVTAARA